MNRSLSLSEVSEIKFNNKDLSGCLGHFKKRMSLLCSVFLCFSFFSHAFSMAHFPLVSSSRRIRERLKSNLLLVIQHYSKPPTVE